MTIRYYSSIAQPTTLASNVTGATLVIDVVAAVGFPTSTPYTLALDYGTALEELVTVTSAAGTTLTVTRGVGGTSAQPHSVGSPVRHVSYSQDFADSRNHEESTTSVHGVTTIVGTTEVQTLTNKTLTSPTINSPIINNADINVARIDPISVAGNALLVTSHATQNDTDTVSVSARSGAINFQINRDAHVFLHHDDTEAALTFVSDVSTSTDSNVMEVYDENDLLTAVIANNGRIASLPRGNVTTAGIIVSADAPWDGDPFTYYRDDVAYWGVDNAGNMFANNFTDGNWPEWTPVFSATGGGFTLGNGTVGGRYAVFGDMVAVEGFLIRGTTTGFGSGDVRCSLPFTPNIASSSHQFIMSAMCYDAGANLPYPATGVIFDLGGGAAFEFCSFKAGTAGRVSGSNAFPFTWAGNTNAAIRFSGMYQMV